MTALQSSSGKGQYVSAALEVLHTNAEGPFENLPRTAAWGYPEPYTRDLMIASIGILVSGDQDLINRLRTVLLTLAKNQSPLGQMPSLVHDPQDLGASDTTPLFLWGLSCYRTASGEGDFLEQPAQLALRWLDYQRIDQSALVGQQPTSDWRDEQWVLGYGLYVNTLVYLCYQSFGLFDRAESMRAVFHHEDTRVKEPGHVIHEGFAIPGKPYYALWAYKVLHNERFDLLGNSLAILSGLADPERALAMITWIEQSCSEMHAQNWLTPDLPPCLIPFVFPGDEDWHPRMELFNRPGEYHNGGIWPFVCGFYIAALVAAGHHDLAFSKLQALDQLIAQSRDGSLHFGFNEWYSAQDGLPRGQDWQTWSAAMYLYAAACVENGTTPFFKPRAE